MKTMPGILHPCDLPPILDRPAPVVITPAGYSFSNQDMINAFFRIAGRFSLGCLGWEESWNRIAGDAIPPCKTVRNPWIWRGVLQENFGWEAWGQKATFGGVYGAKKRAVGGWRGA
jgi:hypothetical protein